MGQVTWDTPPTEEELKGTPTGWDTPPTEAEMGNVDTPEYVAETPVAPEVDEFASSISMLPEGTVQAEDAGNQTITQPELQDRQVKQFAEDEEADIGKTIAEIQQATTTSGDQ